MHALQCLMIYALVASCMGFSMNVFRFLGFLFLEILDQVIKIRQMSHRYCVEAGPPLGYNTQCISSNQDNIQ